MVDLDEQYAGLGEQERLTRSFSSRLEFVLTTEAMAPYLRAGARVCEFGAATGRYALHYARLGHPVTAVEVVGEQASSLERAGRAAELPVRVFHADARSVPDVPDASHEATLVLGPLYHLTQEADPRAVLREAKRVTVPGGMIAVAYINRFFMTGYYAQRAPELLDPAVINELLLRGTVSDPRADGFSRVGYFATPEEIETLLSSEGLTVLDHLATDGIGRLFTDDLEKLTPRQQEHWTDVQRSLARERALLGASNHGLTLARNPG